MEQRGDAKNFYVTINEPVCIENIVKRSRFIGNIAHTKTKEDALDFSECIKRKYRDASHNVVAYNIFRGGLSFCTDDKEPRGTAGMPILGVLKKKEIFDVCVVVSRYFGGILLGSKGLVSAYANVCKDLIKNSSLAQCCFCDLICLQLDYKYLSAVDNILLKYRVRIVEKDFSSKIILKILIEQTSTGIFRRRVFDITKSSGGFTILDSLWERL